MIDIKYKIFITYKNQFIERSDLGSFNTQADAINYCNENPNQFAEDRSYTILPVIELKKVSAPKQEVPREGKEL